MQLFALLDFDALNNRVPHDPVTIQYLSACVVFSVFTLHLSGYAKRLFFIKVTLTPRK